MTDNLVAHGTSGGYCENQLEQAVPHAIGGRFERNDVV
jgi:hypothetical protein